jgi:hypothetical protein
LCSNCGKSTESIRGRCPNCAFLKHPEAAPPVVARRVGGGSVWDDLEDLTLLGLWLAPVLTLVVLGLVFSLDLLLVVGAVIFLVPPGLRALFDWF